MGHMYQAPMGGGFIAPKARLRHNRTSGAASVECWALTDWANYEANLVSIHATSEDAKAQVVGGMWTYRDDEWRNDDFVVSKHEYRP